MAIKIKKRDICKMGTSSDSSLIALKIQSPNGTIIHLPEIPLHETVINLRVLLLENPNVCMFTCYHFECSHEKEIVTLNEFSDINEYKEMLENGVVKMKLDLYDYKKATYQVKRFREYLKQPVVHVPQKEELQKEEPQKEELQQEEIIKEEREDALKKLQKIHEKIGNQVYPVEDCLGTFYKEWNKELPTCLKSMDLSGFNPPPGNRMMQGDLFYLEVVTMDNVVLHVTSHVSGFYVNRSNLEIFDPLPAKNCVKYSTIHGLLMAKSNDFKTRFLKLNKVAADRNGQPSFSYEKIVENATMEGGPCWIKPLVKQHGYDVNRAQEHLQNNFGMEDAMRDWNEEYQCCKELPHESVQDTILRSRMVYKVLSEFVQAATDGAVAIIQGHISAINPMEEKKAHVYVYNNIFYSQSLDTQEEEKETSQDDAAHASANHDLQGVLAYDLADVDGLHTLATCIVDFIGVRMVAQSIIPGILQGEAASKLVYGSVDVGKTIASNSKMHQLMQKAGDKLHIATRQIQPLGLDGTPEDAVEKGEAGVEPVQICGPVEAKGILGSDNRHYVLDLVRTTPRDAGFYASHDSWTQSLKGVQFSRSDFGYTALLRPELLHLFSIHYCKRALVAKTAESEKKDNEKIEQATENSEEAAKKALELKENEMAELEEAMKNFKINPNVFMKYPASTNDAEKDADTDLATQAAQYLQNVMIPAFLTDLQRGVNAPVDGQALTDAMHGCGINMRYLGRMAELAKELDMVTRIPKYVLELLEVEMISRATKKVVAEIFAENEALRSLPLSIYLGILNAVFGKCAPANASPTTPTKTKKKSKKKKKRNSTQSVEDDATAEADESDNMLQSLAAPEFEVTAKDIWEKIAAKISGHFGYKLYLWGEDRVPNRSLPLPLLRRVCQKLGVCIFSKDYDFKSATPFDQSDIIRVFPVVKSSLPKNPSMAAAESIESGRTLLRAGSLSQAYDCLQDAATVLYRVCGSAHQDAALCCTVLATILYHAGDMQGALYQQQRAVTLYTQLCGIDYHDSAFAHANLALFLHANNQTDEAVKHMNRSIYLFELMNGKHLPEVCTLYYKLGMMYQDVGHVSLALQCYAESLQRGEFNKLQAANTLHQMGLTCKLAGGYRGAVTYEKKAYTLYKEMFGENDTRTEEASKNLTEFLSLAVAGEKTRKHKEIAAAAEAMAKELTTVENISPENVPVDDGFTTITKGRKI